MKRRMSGALAVVGVMMVIGLSWGQAAAQQMTAEAPSWNNDGGPKPMHDFMQRAWGRMTSEDRAALFDAHLAALHVALKLTPDQEKLWPPPADALRPTATP